MEGHVRVRSHTIRRLHHHLAATSTAAATTTCSRRGGSCSGRTTFGSPRVTGDSVLPCRRSRREGVHRRVLLMLWVLRVRMLRLHVMGMLRVLHVGVHRVLHVRAHTLMHHVRVVSSGALLSPRKRTRDSTWRRKETGDEAIRHLRTCRYEKRSGGAGIPRGNNPYVRVNSSRVDHLYMTPHTSE